MASIVRGAATGARLWAVHAGVPRRTWREVCESDPDSLPEHRPEWVEAICSTGRFEDVSRLYDYADGRRFVLPLVRRRGLAGAGAWLCSPPAAWGMGGLVGADVDHLVIDDVLQDIAGLGAMRVSIRPDPVRAPLWAGLSMPGLTEVRRTAHVLELGEDAEAVEAGYSPSMRQNVRRAERHGVTVQLDHGGPLLEVHYELFHRSVERWAAKQREPLALARWRAVRRDPLQKLRAMANHLGEGFCQFVAFSDGTPVASIIVLVGRTAHYTRGAMDVDLAGPLRANELLHARAVRHAVASGCTRYHLGESGDSASLARFKEKLGAVAHPYSEYRLERLPVTRMDTAGRTALKRLIGFQDT